MENVAFGNMNEAYRETVQLRVCVCVGCVCVAIRRTVLEFVGDWLMFG